MTDPVHVWNLLSSKFNTTTDQDKIDPAAADNILIAWPPIVRLIRKTFPRPKQLKALDYGCGTGSFCHKLRDLGFTVTGMDFAEKMIKIAKANSPQTITFQTGEYHLLNSKQYSLITSIMTFPFIASIEEAIAKFSQALVNKGLLVIADFNPAWVSACLQQKQRFKDFDSVIKPTRGTKIFGGDMHVPVYIRTVEKYVAIAKKYSLRKILESYPPFTNDFIAKYPSNRPTDVSEFLILGFRKDFL